MEDLVPLVSVVICTRNRGARVVQTLHSVFANQYPSFEVIVVDQSANQETEYAVAAFRKDPRFREIRSTTVGTGKSRNIGLRAARGELVAYTDDDCTVPEDWIAQLTRFLSAYPKIAVGFCSVLPGPHLSKLGTIPNHKYARDRVIRRLSEYYSSIGMGAGMVVRRTMALSLGGFDEQLGPGSKFPSAEDHDIAIRALVHGFCIGEMARTWVVHDGFRTHAQFRDLTRRDWVAIGAAYGKYLRCLQIAIVLPIGYNSLVRGIIEPLVRLAHLQKPHGFRRLFYLWRGICLGVLAPIDRLSYLFLES
jgi:glycosyltransferase involved in cell wall biosynthesis